MALTIPQFQDTLNGIVAAVAANTVITQNGVTVQPDFSIGSWNMTFSEVLALALDLLYTQVANVYAGSFVATAVGSDLDSLGALVGLPRLQPTAAQALATISTSTPPITVSSGAVVLIYDSTGIPNLAFTTQQALTISGASGTVTVVAEVGGSASTISGTTTALLQTPIGGVNSITLAPLSPAVPGTDAETDTAYRARIIANTFVNKGTRSNILSTVAALAGVKAAYVYTDGSGNVTDGGGLFGVLVQPINGTSLTTSQQAAVTAAIAALKSAGITLSPGPNGWALLTPTLANVTLTVKIRDTTQSATTTAAVNAAITAYLNGLAMGAPILVNALINTALNVPNVYDATSLSVVYNSTTYTVNVTVAPNAVAGSGTHTINWSA